MKHTSRITAALLLSVTAATSRSADAQSASPIAGTWTLVAADLLHADGTRTTDYGASPKGLLIVDANGRYSLQIFRSERPRFASGDKVTGSAAEFQEAAIGSSTHCGRMSLDTVGHVLSVNTEGSSFPNQEEARHGHGASGRAAARHDLGRDAIPRGDSLRLDRDQHDHLLHTQEE